MYDNEAHHEIFRGWEGGRIRSLYLQGVRNGAPKLWIGIDGEMVYMDFPKYTMNPLEESGFEVQPVAEVISVTHDFGYRTLPAYIKSLTIHTVNVNSDCYIDVYYQWNDDVESSTWYKAGTITSGPYTEIPIRLGNVYAFRYRLVLVVQDADNIPQVEAVAVKAFSRTPVSYQWTVPAVASSTGIDVNSFQEMDPNDLYERLIDYADDADVLYVRSSLPRLDGKYVVVEPTSIRRQSTREDITEGHQEEANLIFILVER
jgi:hypothetical protein